MTHFKEDPATHFYRPELVMGTVATVKNRDPNASPIDNRMKIDMVPGDNHQFGLDFAVVLPPGLARRPRQGQFVAGFYMQGCPQLGYVLGHSFNNDVSPPYWDMWPLTQLQSGATGWAPGEGGDIIPNLDDYAIYHDETGALLRFRSVGGATAQAGPLGGAGIFEFWMRSGASFHFEEIPNEPQPNPPQPPGPNPPTPLAPCTRAKFNLDMPAGTSVVYDEPKDGVGTLLITIPNNNGQITVGVDDNGNVTFDLSAASGAVFQVKTDGSDSSIILGDHSAAKEVAWRHDLDEVISYINNHVHSDAGGTGDSGPPTASAPATTGASITIAE